MRRWQQEIAGYAWGALSPSRPEWYERFGWVRRQALDHGLQSERPRAAACDARATVRRVNRCA